MAKAITNESKHARSIWKAAARSERKGNREFKMGDKDQAEMFWRDARDLSTIADRVYDSQPYAALAKAERMDTAARELIPTAAWNFIVKSNHDEANK